MASLPSIEAVLIDITSTELIRLLSPSNKNGVMFFTSDKKKVFVDASKKKPAVIV